MNAGSIPSSRELIKNLAATGVIKSIAVRWIKTLRKKMAETVPSSPSNIQSSTNKTISAIPNKGAEMKCNQERLNLDSVEKTDFVSQALIRTS